MGSSKSKPRKKTAYQQQHLPKVNSRSYGAKEQQLERKAVLGNMGMRSGSGTARIVTWVIIVVILLGLVFGVLGWLFI